MPDEYQSTSHTIQDSVNSHIKVSGLFIYPVKSLRGLALDSAIVEDRGFRFDRRWMVVDERSVFMTQRDHPRMSLIATSIGYDDLHLRVPRMPALNVPLRRNSGTLRSVVVWSDTVKALEVPGTGDWFRAVLKITITHIIHG